MVNDVTDGRNPPPARSGRRDEITEFVMSSERRRNEIAEFVMSSGR